MLKDLKFSDVYLAHDSSLLRGVPGKLDPVPAPEDCAEELAALRTLCEKVAAETEKVEFAIRQANVAYRVNSVQSLNGTVYVLRKFPKEVPKLTDLGIYKGYVEQLMEPRLTGLMVIAGAYGQGKTTTASSVVCARLSVYGGIAFTIEDPPEMPLEGRHGEGQCYQTWVEQGGFSEACRKMARNTPSIVYIGEVRDPETATEALRASINGRLVICTTHAESAVLAVSRLFNLANGAAGNSDDVASLLSNGLAGVLHQTLEGDPKRLRTESLWLSGPEALGARNTILHRRFPQLHNEVELQRNRMRSRKAAQTS